MYHAQKKQRDTMYHINFAKTILCDGWQR